MKSVSKWLDSLKGGGFIKGSAAGLSEMFLGWRSLLLGCGGTLLGFVGAITNNGIGTRLALLAIGIVSLPLAIASWRYMKRKN
ncbi:MULTISPECIES: hypothetical protein [unclassified Streptomyces]|uniref:hypothetical protein n=1 Tax=unclassified Streptomyces TaxID=2593676 RepID=UPI00381D991C